MRFICLSDVTCLARRIAGEPYGVRYQVAKNIVRDACIADDYRETTGKLHPTLGCGAVSAVARIDMDTSVNLDLNKPDHLHCLEVAASAIGDAVIDPKFAVAAE